MGLVEDFKVVVYIACLMTLNLILLASCNLHRIRKAKELLSLGS